jgi:peroxiredoxin
MRHSGSGRSARRLPSVPLAATDGRDIALARRPGRLLLIVYPWAGRPGKPNPPDWDAIAGAHGSTPELQGFRDRALDFARLGIALFGLSRQTTDEQRELVARLGLPFPILSDAGDRLWPALGLQTFQTGGEHYLKRITLLIAEGRIRRRFDAPEPAGHAAELLTKLRHAR